jgi:UDP:flavonoid glycosyltransferase YjiC (YdhE family)
MFGSLALGLPQLLLPHGADQFTNAEVLLGSGAGLRLLPGEITADTVEAGARTLLTEASFRQAARRQARDIAAMPGPDEVARQVIDLAAVRV